MVTRSPAGWRAPAKRHALRSRVHRSFSLVSFRRRRRRRCRAAQELACARAALTSFLSLFRSVRFGSEFDLNRTTSTDLSAGLLTKKKKKKEQDSRNIAVQNSRMFFHSRLLELAGVAEKSERFSPAISRTRSSSRVTRSQDVAQLPATTFALRRRRDDDNRRYLHSSGTRAKYPRVRSRGGIEAF